MSGLVIRFREEFHQEEVDEGPRSEAQGPGEETGRAPATVKTTTATRTWLALVASTSPAAWSGRTPRLARMAFRTMASGMLWMARATAMEIPKGRDTSMAAPMATPS